MTLAALIQSFPVRSVSGTLEKEIVQISFDSREVVPGTLFCALPGVKADGNQFVEKALEAGAIAIFSQLPYPANTDATWIQVHDAREAMALAAANFYGNPSLELPVVGVTGTNGKTTTSLLVHHLMKCSLRRAGLIGTIHYVIDDQYINASHTTPESTELQRLLREMRDADCRGVVMEVSSHALAQHRTTGVHFNVGIFTNLSQDHLDYHGTMEAYFEAKKLLLDRMETGLRKKSVMIINRDDKYGERLFKAPGFDRVERIGFGRSASCQFRASDIKFNFNGTQFTLSIKDHNYLVKTPLIGGFNVYNTLAAIATAKAINLNVREAIHNLETCPQVPGRLESVSGGRKINYRVFVDYAHTPDALKNALQTLRELNPRRLITVFGCGGDRDRTKRAPMAEAAEALSDICLLTSDNPRTENPEQILVDAEKGFHGKSFESILDRREAIRRAINLAGEKDIVLIAGKGHESYQEINGVRHDFDDRLEACNAIAAKAETTDI